MIHVDLYVFLRRLKTFYITLIVGHDKITLQLGNTVSTYHFSCISSVTIQSEFFSMASFVPAIIITLSGFFCNSDDRWKDRSLIVSPLKPRTLNFHPIRFSCSPNTVESPKCLFIPGNLFTFPGLFYNGFPASFYQFLIFLFSCMCSNILNLYVMMFSNA